MAWPAHSTYVVAGGGPALIILRLVVHVATPVGTTPPITEPSNPTKTNLLMSNACLCTDSSGRARAGRGAISPSRTALS